MIQVIGIGGEPGSGKSRLVQAIVAALVATDGPGQPWHHITRGGRETVLGSFHERARVLVLGLGYEGQLAEAPARPYPGTDRLSMAVSPIALRAVEAASRNPRDHGLTVLFEGDRLFTGKFLRGCEAAGASCAWVMLLASAEELARRRLARADAKGAVFLLGRQTKARRLMDSIAARMSLEARAAEQASGAPPAGTGFFLVNNTDEEAERNFVVVETLVGAFRERSRERSPAGGL